MSDNKPVLVPVPAPAPEQQSLLGELFSIAEEAKGLISEVRSPSVTRVARTIEDEPHEPDLVLILRSLVTHDTVVRGGIRLIMEEGQFRVIIGEGIAMRVTEASTLGGAIIRATEREGVFLTAHERAGNPFPGGSQG